MPYWFQDYIATLATPGLWHSYRHVFWVSFLDDGVRYLACVLLVWGLLHVVLRKRLAHRLISSWPSSADVRREMAYSLSTLAVLSAVNAGVLALMVSGVVEVYHAPLKYGLVWLVLSLPAAVILHDFYFYWTHRALHTRWLFRHVHGIHHRSRSPSPWAAFSFHPVEAVVQSAALPFVLLLIPLNEYVVFAFALHQMIRNVQAHTAVEIHPRGFPRHWFWGRFGTTTHHHLHHETAQGNYGLWFTWWDRWCGTERPDYLVRFDAATAPRSQPVEDSAGVAA